MNKTLTIMCGIPGVGKTTWIQKNKGKSIIVSSDDIRSEIFGQQFCWASNKFIFAMMEAFVRLLLKNGESVIVDATHLTKISRIEWIRLASQYGAIPKIVLVYANLDDIKNLEECLKRNKNSGERFVPEADLSSMAYSFQKPSFSECEIIEWCNK
jgi:predicted kinase